MAAAEGQVPSLTETTRTLSISEQSQADNSSDLTPLRAHYLKKTLVSLQFEKELRLLSTVPSNPSVSVLSYLGPPFNPPPKDDPTPRDLLFTRFFFRQFVLTFPFLSSAPKNFFPQKLQPFIDSLLAKNIAAATVFDTENPQIDVEEVTKKKLLQKLEKQMAFLMGSAVKLTEPEEVVRLNQRDLDRLETLAKKRRTRKKDKFEVNVIGVRSISEKRHVRTRTHDEFIIRTRKTGFEDIYVARRAGDFKTLADELRKAHPEEEIRPPPAKDRTTIATPSSQGILSGYLTPSSTQQSQPGSTDSLPIAPSVSNQSTTSIIHQYGLAREKNRLTLRAYLNSLLTSQVIASSPVLRSFLTANPIKLTAEELEDARRREDADRLREEGKAKFDQEVKDRVEKLRDAIKNVKGDLLGQNGLTHVFSTIRTTPEAKDLPSDYHAVLEWGRITSASTLFHHFIATDNASETFASLKRVHGMMPYFMMKGILKISNPVAMIRGILDLFTAQPFGGKSLLQRMFTSSLYEESKAVQEDIELVSDKIEDPVLCEKIRQFVNAPREIQAIYRMDAVEEKCNLITVIMRSSEAPVLNRAQLQRIARASRAHAEYVRSRQGHDSDSDDGPQDEEGWLYEDLGVLMRLYGKLRDLEQLIALIHEGTTAELLKDIITLFYAPLAQVYKAANIADSLGDLQNFINDLIKTVEQVDQMDLDDPTKTVQRFIALVERHEQSFYRFVHNVQSKGEGLFDSLMKWVELFITFVREGLGSQVSLEFMLPHTGKERGDIMKEVDAVALYHYKLKVAHEEKVRRKFGSGRGSGATQAEQEAAQALVDGVVSELSFGELVEGDANELAEEDESDEDSNSSGEYYTDSSEEETTESEDDENHTHHTSSTSVFDETSPRLKNSDNTHDDLPPPPPPKDVPSRHIRRQASATSTPLPPSPHDAGYHHHQHHRAPQRSMTHHDQVQPGHNDSRNQVRRPTALDALHQLSSGSSGNTSSKPLPRTPLSHARTPSSQSTPSQRKVKKNPEAVIQPPELKAIPELLPIFLELVRPGLRTRSL
ncbi:hypothetical protein FRC03_009649 [Tulasnella sp. 419]|nr:hypothetical protein FRC03_009649 [Tulasnella sp. 419]